MPRYQLFIFTVIRTVLNTSHRMIYPFLAVFARGLGVEISVVSGVVASRSLVAAVTPFLFPFRSSKRADANLACRLGWRYLCWQWALCRSAPALPLWGLLLSCR